MQRLTARVPALPPVAAAAAALAMLAGLLAFYGQAYSVHQDLAGSALSGRLALTLGDAFAAYSSYFPPAERAWFSLTAMLSEWTGARLDLTVVAMTGVAVLVSATLAYRIRVAAGGASGWFFLVPAAVLIIVPVLYKNVFGLREHMVALGLWPYLVLRASDPDGSRIGRRLRLAVGLWLGAMLLFKYLYSLVVALVEMADAALQRRPLLLFRVENLVAGGIVALYLFGWLVLDPAQRATIGAVRSAIDANLADPASNAMTALSKLFPALVFALVLRLSKVPGRTVVLGLAMVVGAIAAAWTQQRWYSHHLFGISMAFLGWWWMAARDLRWWGHVPIALFLGATLNQEHANTRTYQRDVAELTAAMRRIGLPVDGRRVGVLSVHPSPYNQYLAAQGALRWVPSMNNSYVASELARFDRPQNKGRVPPPVRLDDPGRRMLHEEMLRLWEDHPPQVMILDQGNNWPLRHVRIDWRQAFANDPRFRAILSHYRPAWRHKGPRLEFEVLVRAD